MTLLLLAAAFASPPSPDTVDRLLEELPEGERLLWPDARGHLVPVAELLPPVPPVPDKGEAQAPPGPAADLPGEAQGGLSGKAVYLSQCHGFIWFDSLDGFSTQRGNLYDTVEDFHNPEGANQYLAPMLENAGARVFTTRERDLNPRMAIADNDGDGYAEQGSGFQGGPAGFVDHAPWAYGEDPFDAGSTRRFPADGGGVATWIPEVPEDGLYAVYVSWDSDSANARDAHYRITHPGGVIDRRFDQTVHGSTWQYVERLWLPAGVEGLKVELIGDSSSSGWLSADAVRVGGGVDDVQRHGVSTGRPRWESGAIQYTQWNGAPTSVYDPYGDGNGSDPSSRSRWADWEHPSGEDALYLSWHSNAGGGTGTSVYSTESTSAGTYADSSRLSALLSTELVGAIRSLWDSGWTDRGVHERNFSEVNPAHNDEMPSALVELAFHDHVGDVELLKDPVFRWDASRAMYRAIVRWFAEQDGSTPVYLPEPPESVAVVQDADGVTLSWEDGLHGEPFGDQATSWVVYRSKDGRSWDGGNPVDERSAWIDLARGETVYLRVAAVNAGGLSFPSETVGLRRGRERARVLVVSAFDRLEGSLLPWEDVGGRVGLVRRMELERVNPFDVIVAHGQALDAGGFAFDSLSDEALERVSLEDYDLVIWAAGEESTAHESFSGSQQLAVRAFVEAGGALWASGAEILWDLDARGSGSDLDFALEVLGARLQEDDADSTRVSGVGLLEGLVLDFGEADGAPYPVEFPDVLRSDGEELALYEDGGLAASITGRVVLMGFPFDCVGSAGERAEAADRIVRALLPDIDEEPGDSGLVEHDTGVEGPGGRGPGERRKLFGGCGSPIGGSLLLGLLGLLASRRRR